MSEFLPREPLIVLIAGRHSMWRYAPARALRFSGLLLRSMMLILTMGAAHQTFAQINRDEEVAFYGPYLYWGESGDLVLVLRGRFLEPERDSVGRRITIDRAIRPALFRYIGKRPSDYDAAALTRMHDRLMPFLADGESREALKVRVMGRSGSAVLNLPKTDSGGHFDLGTSAAGDIKLTDLAGDGLELRVAAVLPADDTRHFAVRLRVPQRRLPLLVISDVDDTVRIADVLDRPRMIERVFLREYEAVPGMATIFGELAMRRAEFHFVSGSPWQIAPVIERLLAAEGFPPSVLHCRQLGWDFWNSDPVHTKEFKISTIETLLKQFQSSRVLLIGDDGEHDPEVYSEICRLHPNRVAGIWIRRVNPQPSDERLALAKGILGAERAVTFKDAAQLEPTVAAIGD